MNMQLYKEPIGLVDCNEVVIIFFITSFYYLFFIIVSSSMFFYSDLLFFYFYCVHYSFNLFQILHMNA